VLLVLAAGSGDARGETFTVDDDGEAEYTKIQDAINVSADGDTIEVSAGTYDENVVVNRSIHLVGEGSEVTIVDGGGSYSAIKITSDWVNLSGFQVIESKRGDEAGIKILSDGNTITDNECTNNYHGIYVSSSDHNQLSNNRCSNNSDNGIRLHGASHNQLSDNTIITNEKEGLMIQNSFHNKINDNVVTDNSEGIKLEEASYILIEDNNVSANEGSGIEILDGSNNNTIKGNDCSRSGEEEEGIEIDDSSYNLIANNVIADNDVGIQLENSHNNDVNNNTITGSLSREEEEGIEIEDSCYNLITNNLITDNDVGIQLDTSHNNDINNNTITGSIIGIYVEDGSENNKAHHNSIHGNDGDGINATYNDGYTINATDNWWGDPSGPYHPGDNSEGKGDNVTDHVEFDPWLDELVILPPLVHIDSITPDPALEGEEVRFEGHGTDDGTIERYLWTSDLDGELHNDTEAYFSTTTLSPGHHTITFKVQDNHGVWSDEVTAALTVNASVIPNKLPVVTITSPVNGGTVNGTITIKGEVTHYPTGNDDAGVYVKIDEGEWKEVTDKVCFLSSCSWQYEWNTQAVPNGSHNISAKAFNGTVWTEVVSIDVTVDNEGGQAPIVQVPVWVVGDSWTWKYSVEADGTLTTITVVETVTKKGVTETDNGTALDEPCYQLEASSRIPGAMKVTAKAWLSMATLDLKADKFNIEGGAIFLYGFLTVVDWPLLITEGGAYEWSDAGTVTVPAGSFHCYKFESALGPMYYSPDIGHFVKVEFGGITFELEKFGEGEVGETEDDEGFTIAGMDGYMVGGVALLLVVLVVALVMVGRSREKLGGEDDGKLKIEGTTQASQPQPYLPSSLTQPQPQQFQPYPQAPPQPPQQVPQFQQSSQLPSPAPGAPQPPQWGQTADLAFPELPEDDEEESKAQPTQKKEEPAEGMWTCSKCGKEVGTKHKFCLYCGNKQA